MHNAHQRITQHIKRISKQLPISGDLFGQDVLVLHCSLCSRVPICFMSKSLVWYFSQATQKRQPTSAGLWSVDLSKPRSDDLRGPPRCDQRSWGGCTEAGCEGLSWPGMRVWMQHALPQLVPLPPVLDPPCSAQQTAPLCLRSTFPPPSPKPCAAQHNCTCAPSVGIVSGTAKPARVFVPALPALE